MQIEVFLKAFPLVLVFGSWIFAPKTGRLKDLVIAILGLLFVYLSWLFFQLPERTEGSYSLISFSFNRPSLFVGAIFCGALFMGLSPVRKDLTMTRNFLLLMGAGVGIILADNMPTFFFFFFFLQRGVPGWNFLKNIRQGSSQSGGTYLIQHFLGLIVSIILMLKAWQSGLIFHPLGEYPATFFTLDVLLLSFILVYEAHGIFPFHSWVHDVVDQLRWYEISCIFLPRAGVLLFVQLLLPNYNTDPDLFKIALLSLSIFSSIYWSFRGIYEGNVQKEVSYFYIAQASLLLTGLQATSVAVRGSYLHMMVISFSGIAIWSILSYIQGHVSLKKSQAFYGLAQEFPKLATLFCLFGFCLIGVPLLASHVVEDLVINGLLEQQPYLGLGHIFATCLNGILFFVLFSKLFLGNNPSRTQFINRDMSLAQMFPYLLTLVMMFLIGVFPFLFLESISW